MAANSNVGSTNSGSSRRTSSSGGRAGSVASSLSKTLSAGSNAEVNSSETSSGSFSCMTTTTSSGSEGAVAAPVEMVGSGGGLRRAASAGGKNKKRFVGVRQRPSGRWVAEIKDTTQKIRLWLGTFDTAEDAARAYDEAAWLLRGANTRTNFVPSTSTDASVLPSKAARLLQLRRNAAAATASSQENNNNSGAAAPAPAASAAAAAAPAPVNSKPPQSQSGTSAGNKLEGNVNANSIYSAPQKSSPTPLVVLPSSDSNSNQASAGSRAPPLTHVTAPSAASTSPYCSSNIGHVSNFSGEVSKSESSNYESSVEEMCEMEEAPALNSASGLYHPDLGGSQRRNVHPTIVNVKQEIVTNTYQPRVEPSPIRENRKEKDYCSEAPPQESFVDDTDMSSGLSGLDDVDLSCVDSVYSSSPFDFSADMGPGLDLGNLISSPLSADLANGEDDSLSEHVRRMSYERQISAGLYAISGVQECLSLSSHSWGPSSWNGGLSSPSLTLAAGFKRSTSGPFLTTSPARWKSVGGSGSSGNGTGSWGTTTQQQPNSSGGSTGSGNNGTNNSSTVAENADCPSQDALWQSWDLPPLCVVA